MALIRCPRCGHSDEISYTYGQRAEQHGVLEIHGWESVEFDTDNSITMGSRTCTFTCGTCGHSWRGERALFRQPDQRTPSADDPDQDPTRDSSTATLRDSSTATLRDSSTATEEGRNQ